MCDDVFVHSDPVLMSLKDGYSRPNQLVFKAPVKEKKSVVVNGIDLLENVPPRTENEVCGSHVINVFNMSYLNYFMGQWCRCLDVHPKSLYILPDWMRALSYCCFFAAPEDVLQTAG